jgi:hypothetical protein
MTNCLVTEERIVVNVIKRRDGVVAFFSIVLPIVSYVDQYLHLLEPIQLLYEMQLTSASIRTIGTNGRPTKTLVRSLFRI